jgi:hypothetical protein
MGGMALVLAVTTMSVSLAACGKYGKPKRSVEPEAAGSGNTGTEASRSTPEAPANATGTQPAMRDETDPRLEGNRR